MILQRGSDTPPRANGSQQLAIQCVEDVLAPSQQTTQETSKRQKMCAHVFSIVFSKSICDGIWSIAKMMCPLCPDHDFVKWQMCVHAFQNELNRGCSCENMVGPKGFPAKKSSICFLFLGLLP